MKPIRILHTVFLLSTLSMLSRAPAFSQAPEATYRVRSSERVNLIDLHVDEVSKDMFLLGEFENTISLSGWGNSEYTLESSAAPKNFFYAHCKADGVAKMWRISANPPGSQTAFVSQIAVASSYVYILGSFSGSMTVTDDSGNTFGPINAEGVDIFLLKFSRADGSFVTLDKIGGSDNDYANRILVDQDDNVIFSGRFKVEVDFSLGSGSDRVASTKTSQGNDVFVAKYNSGDDLLNLTVIGGTENQDEIFAMIGDDDQNVYVVGKFNNSLVINSGSSSSGLSTTKKQQVFFTKLDANLNPQWLKLLEKSDEDTGGGVDQRLDVAYDALHQQLLMVWETRWGPLIYDGNPLGRVQQNNNVYVLKIAANTGNFSQQFSIGSDLYEDSKQIATDDQGNYLVSGTFQGKLEHTGGGLTKTTSKDGTNNTFLAAFGTNEDPSTSDRLVYLSGFHNQGSVYASRRMFVFDEGNELQVFVPMVYEKGAVEGLDDRPLNSFQPENLDILIAQYRFPSIPSVNVDGVFARDPSAPDPEYIYGVSGDNIREGVTARLRDTDDRPIEVGTPYIDDDELLFGLPTNLVAGKKYRVELDKGPYKNFYAFGTFSIPPAVFALEDKDGTCEETLKVPGRYFGTVANDVQVLLYRGETEVGTATVLVATGEELQIKLPSVYPDTYQLRVRVNGEESPGDEVTVLPHITRITPASVEPGETIVAEGCDFVVNESTSLPSVTLQKDGDAPISVTPTVAVAVPTKLNVPLPNDLPSGAYTLNVTVNGSLATGTTTFTVIDPSSTRPAIQSLSATMAKPGDELTIQGRNLTASAGETIFVRIEGRDPVTATANEDGTAITFTVPDIPEGDYNLTVTVGEQEAEGTLTLRVLSENEPSPLGTPSAEPGNRTATGFTLSWSAIDRASRYVVEVATDDTFDEASIVFSDTITELTQPIGSLTTGQTYYYRVKAINNEEASGVNERAITMFEISSDPNNPTTYETGITLATEVLGVTDGSSVKLILQGLSTQKQKEFDASVSENNRYSIPLAATDLDDPIGIEYRFRVKNEVDSLQTDELRIYRQYSQVAMTLPDKETPKQEDYRLVAFPFQGQAVTAALTGANTFHNDSIRLLRYDPATANNTADKTDYQEYKESGFNNFEPGRGYWLLKRKGIDLAVQGTAAEVDADRNFTIELQQGWNLVGNPFPFAIDVTILGGDDKLFYGASGFQSASTKLEAYQGLLVESMASTTIILSATDANNGRHSSAPKGISGYHDRPLNSDRWFVGLNVSNGYLTNRLIGVGMHREADDALDRFDMSLVPRFQRFVEAQFVNPLVPYALERDIVAPATQYSWKFNLVADAASEEISVAWDNRRWGDNDRQLLLLDTEAQRLINMREVSNYTFRPTQPERTFELYYGSEDELHERVLPHRVQVGQAFPNPATEQVSISLSIPPSQPEIDVLIQITDIAGRTVQRLQQPLGAGFHTLSWGRHNEQQQTLPSGLYLYRVSVGKEQFVGKFIYQME